MPPRMGTLLTSLTTLALLLAACSSPSDPEDMLLAPQDFPERELEVERTNSVELGGGERSAEIVLSGKTYKVYQSVVVFQGITRAQEVMESLRVSEESLGTRVAQTPEVGEEALGVFKDRSAGNRSFIVFRQGNALVRVTLEGEGSVEDLVLFAQKAAEKVG